MATARTTARMKRRRRPNTSAISRGLGPILISFFAALVVLPTTIVATVGLLPAIAAFMVDEDRPRYLFRGVLGMNLAALWPFLNRLWWHGNDVRLAVAIVGDVYTWAAIYGASGLGWLLFYTMPSLLAGLRRFAAQRRIEQLKSRQAELKAEWGAAIPDGSEAVPAGAAGSGG